MSIDLRKITCIGIALFALGTACSVGPLEPEPEGTPGQLDRTGEPPAMPPEGVPPEGEGPQYTWWRDVEPIVRSRCQHCHAALPLFGAPMALVDYGDTQTVIHGVPMHEIMAYRIVAEQNRMPPSTQPGLTEEEKRIIQAWSSIGAPEGVRGEGMDLPPKEEDGPGDPGTSRPISSTIEMRASEPDGTPYRLPVVDTNYVCWSVTVPVGIRDQSVFRMEPILDDTTHMHHILVFHDANGGNAAGPFPCGSFPLDWNLIAGWAPGRGADEVPPGVGIPMVAGAQLVLQLHYDRVTAFGKSDSSGMRILMTDEPNLIPAGVLWSGVIWGAPLIGSDVSRSGVCTLVEPVTLFAVFPHMHQFGTRIMLEVRRADSRTWSPLVDISGWSFEDQPNILIPPEEQSFMPGDQIRTTCWWNTQGRAVSFGEASSDEMCFNFIFHFPALAVPSACIGLSL